MEPNIIATVYLYDGSQPNFTLATGATPHVAITVPVGQSSVTIAAWDVETLRRFAAVCADAADVLEGELDRRPVAAMGGMA